MVYAGMPSDANLEDIDMKFLILMEELHIPYEARAQMHMYDHQKKYLMLMQHEANMPQRKRKFNSIYFI